MTIEEHALRHWVRQVFEGKASRRQFMHIMLGLGLSGPFIANLLAVCGGASAHGQPAGASAFTPTKRGGGGKLRLLWWQAPTILNAHLAVGLKDHDAARVVYEPLTSVNAAGNFVPILARELPSLENGDLARDGTWVIWRLKPGVVWHDGRPFTAADVIFTWEYASDPATGTTSIGAYERILRMEQLDDHAVKVVFQEPTPLWRTGGGAQILPKHLFAAYKGQHARDAPYNLKPVGTGPYKIVEFKPGDVALYELNSHYHVPNRPFFDTVELKGGGDATSAARAVIQTGEFDFAWNMLVEKDVLDRIERQGTRGSFHIYPGAGLEHIQLNRTDPWTEVDGERSSLKLPHPFLTDLLVRRAYNVAVDRRAIVEHLYGSTGQVSSNVLNSPPPFQSPNTH
jgi:peptide/nickel transport system substrate-binding protein